MRFYLSALSILIFLMSAAFSEDTKEIKPLSETELSKGVNLATQSGGENAMVQSRTLPEETQKHMLEQALREEEEEATIDQEDEEDVQIQTGLFANQYPQLFFPCSCHSICIVSLIGDSIALEDGSIWSIHPSGANEVMRWKESDILLIYPNNAWFSSYKYKICNQTLKTQVVANMTAGPTVKGEFTLQIVSIDSLKNEIYLNDNSHWKIFGSDNYLLKEFLVGDYIIVGTNNSWRCSLKNILINSNIYNHVRAQQF